MTFQCDFLLFRFTYRFTDEKTTDTYNYTMRICEGVQISTGNQYHSSHVGVVQQFRDKSINVGSINDTIITGGTDWIMLTYRKGMKYQSHCSKQERKAHIMIVCDPYSLKVETQCMIALFLIRSSHNFILYYEKCLIYILCFFNLWMNLHKQKRR